MPETGTNYYFVQGNLHGDHSDSTSDYERRYDELRAEYETKGIDPREEFEQLRDFFADENGNSHADHADGSGDYSRKWERFQMLMGDPNKGGADNSPISRQGVIRDQAWKDSLVDIIRVEREKLRESLSQNDSE
ncbi:MAG: hypothetical protein VW683_01585 [Betaproteobacteria bacterium]